MKLPLKYITRELLLLILTFFIIVEPASLYASNYSWVQNDWTGGADVVAKPGHPSDQVGWTKFFSKDLYVDTSVPGVTLYPKPASVTQTADILDFNRGTLSSVKIVGNGSYISTRYEETSPSVTKTGSWTSNAFWSPSGGSWISSFTRYDAVSFTFSGSGVSWSGFKYSTFGIANVYIDNVLKGTVDLYSPTQQSSQVLWSISNLTNTSHTLKIEVSGTRNPNSTYTYISIDAFDVSVPNPDNNAYLMLADGKFSVTQTADILDFARGTLNNVKIVGNGTNTTTRYEETNASVTKAGTWTSNTFWTPSGGSWISSTTKNDTVSFSFNGSGVAWIGFKYSAFGKAYVYIDNVLQATVDLYDPNQLNQQVLWSISNLANTSHTLKIEVAHIKNPSSVGYMIGIDAFDVTVPHPDNNAYVTILDNILSGTYTSPTFDVGPEGGFFFNLSWTSTVPAGSNLKFQMAANNDNATWNFVGPDGTAGTYYTASPAAIFSGHYGNRYFRYKAFFDRPSIDPLANPVLNDVTINYGLISVTHGTYESPSFDGGVGGALYSNLVWNSIVPPGSSLKFQIATNNDNATWNFKGPDGTTGTYYITSGTPIFSGHDTDRYMKFKAYFNRLTVEPADSPTLQDITINYGQNPASQSLVSSPYDSTDITNVINRLIWSEDIPTGTDLVLQLRTSPDGIAWGPWYGPHNTTFSGTAGVTQVTVADVTGFITGSRITITNIANAAQSETKKISAIDSVNKKITLDSAITFNYAAGSYLTDAYTDPSGKEPVNPNNRSGYLGTNDDRWFQYRVFLFTTLGSVSPTLLETHVGYFTANGIYQPDEIIDGNGNGVYGDNGTGGSSAKQGLPGFVSALPVTYNFSLQNDGTSATLFDTYTISWNTPSDVSGNWTVYLNDGVTDLSSPVTVPLDVFLQKDYTIKITPTNYAPGGVTQDVVLNVHSENDYAKIDSVKASTLIQRVYKADGLIDGAGNDLYDSNKGGTGGTSLLKEASGPGVTISYPIIIQNEGNTSDAYTFSLIAPPPDGWLILLNDGTNDHDITNPAGGWTTPSIVSMPSISNFKAYTLKVIPKGPPVTTDFILNIYSTGAAVNIDSLTIRTKLNGAYKVDGIINGYSTSGTGCGTSPAGDNVYGALSSGNGGCTALDIPAGNTMDITLGIQNEGNLADTFRLSWSTPASWTVKMLEKLNDGSTVEYNTSPIDIPTALQGNPSVYNPGEIPSFTFRITSPSSFNSGSQAIIFDITSLGDNTRVDSVKAVVNSVDTTPPASMALSPGGITVQAITVSWQAPGDDGTGCIPSRTPCTAVSYDLRYSATPINNDTDFINAVKVRSCKPGETNLGKPKPAGDTESCTIAYLFANTDYYFALKTSDDAGNISAISTCTTCPGHTLSSSDTTQPGVISDLAVTGVTKDTMTLCWTANADDGSVLPLEAVTGYNLRYSRRYIVDDGVTPGVGEINFSNSTPLTPAGGFLVPKSPGMKECYIVPVENKINLGGGIFDDRTQNTRFYFAVKSLDEVKNESSISNIGGGLTSLIANSYNMVSVPYKPVPDSPVNVFGDDVGAQLYLYGWDSRGANWDNGCYNGWPLPHNIGNEVCSQLTSVVEGRGYFLWVPSASVSLDVPSTSTAPLLQDCVDDTQPTPVHFQCYVMPLKNGWNTIGSTADKEIYFSSRDVNGVIERGLYLRKTTGSTVEVAKFQDAVSATNPAWIDGSVYTFNGTTYTYETCNQDGLGEPLGTQCSLLFQPWKSYWINVLGSTSTFELLIPF
ncbi:MAG: hypothetical protein HZA08_04450 [Nitrospirae bacterium]|nr:hypothetical protein [Nitrospirota bacterium]